MAVQDRFRNRNIGIYLVSCRGFSSKAIAKIHCLTSSRVTAILRECNRNARRHEQGMCGCGRHYVKGGL